MIELGLLLAAILIYYLLHGYKFISLRRLPEPIFIVNIGFLLNFPARAVALLCFQESLESAPTFSFDLDTLNPALLYSFLCITIFNESYEYFLNRWQLNDGFSITDKEAMSPVPTLLYCFYLALGSIYMYYVPLSSSGKTWGSGVEDVSRYITALQFAFDFIILSSVLMFLRTRRAVYLAVGVMFLGVLAYHSFFITAKYPLIAYSLMLAILTGRAGYRIPRKYILAVAVIATLNIMVSYSTRYYGLELISPDVPLSARFTALSEVFDEFSPSEILQKFFLFKITDRYVYLETLTVYMQYADLGETEDLYDRVGSLPTAVLAVPTAVGNLFGVDKSSLEHMHVWFGSKYWYGEAWPSMSVVIPIGRINESYMMGRWLGCLLFVGYAYLFARVYGACYQSNDPLLVIYYLLIYYYYILVDDFMFYQFGTIVYASAMYFSFMFIYKSMNRNMKPEAAHAPAREEDLPTVAGR